MTNRRSVLALMSTTGGGDRHPVVALACGLRDRGDQVTVLCDLATEKLIAGTDLPTLTIPPGRDQDSFFKHWGQELQVKGGVPDESTPNPLIEWATITQPIVQEAVSKIKPELIISTLFCMGLADVLATNLGIPWCFVNPSFYFGDHSPRKWEDDWYGPFVHWFAKSCFFPLSLRATIALHATDKEFDIQPSQLPPNHHYVGFLLWEPVGKVPEYVNQAGDPWALITLSTLPQQGELILARSALWALADQPVRTLLPLAQGHPKDELGNLPNNATVAEYVPHSPVLKQSSIVVSHAGHGIVSKALYYGVPMVLLPWDRDQPGVAARAERLGVAVVIPRHDVSSDSVGKAVATVLHDPSYRETVARVSSRLIQTEPVGVAYRLLGTL